MRTLKCILVTRTIDILGKDLFEELLEIKDVIQLNETLSGFFDRYFLVNKVLSNHNFFLKFFERRDKFRFMIKEND